MNRRLQEVRNRLNLNQADFGELIGLSKASVSALEKGTRNITDRHIMLICSELKVDEKWFRHGEGEMFVEDDDTLIKELAAKCKLSDLESLIIKHFVNLDSDTRSVIKDYVLSLSKEVNDSKPSSVGHAVSIDPEDEIEEELERYRRELEAEKKGITSSATDGSA